MEARNPEKNHNTSTNPSENPDEAECRHYHRVDAVLRPVVFYQEKYCPSWEGNDTNHFKEAWHQKHVGLTGLPAIFLLNIYNS